MQVDMKRIDSEINMDRFYSVELTKDLFGKNSVHRQWGRSGSWGCYRRDTYETKIEAQGAITKLIKSKLSRGYVFN